MLKIFKDSKSVVRNGVWVRVPPPAPMTFQNKEFNIEYKYKSKIRSLEKENNHLHKIIDKFYETIDKFIIWICKKFGLGESKELIKDFQEETHTFIDPIKQLKNEEMEKEWDLER